MIYDVIFVVIVRGGEVDVGVVFEGSEEGGDDVGIDEVCYCEEFFWWGYGGVVFYCRRLGERKFERGERGEEKLRDWGIWGWERNEEKL